uniref:histidine kinase n=1 Tax=Dechloromonas aromatica (strain RCB) TaxID=159087 RepID=Q47FQ2_DECAR
MQPKTNPPRQREPLSLRQRLILALLTPLIVILASSSIFDYQLAKKTANRAHDQALADNVFDLESHIKRQNPSPTLDLTEEAEAMLRSNAPDMLYFSVSDSSGKVLAGDTDLPKTHSQKSEQVEFRDGIYQDKAVRIASHRANIRNREFQIVVLETTEKRQQASSRILTAMVIPNLAVILATMLAVIFGVRQGLLPLREVEHDIAVRSANDLHEIELSGTPSEIRPMLHRLNELFALVRESVEVQQRFIADAAHQLRTPLAGLQTQLDLATSEGAFSNNVERLQLIEESTARIGHLLTQLLTYARAETSNAIKANFEPVQLNLLAENSASIFLDAALAKNIDLGFEISPTTTLGFPWMLQEALSNLIDNAIRYTPPGGIITVRSSSADKQACIEVEDSGPGIPDEHLKHVFERFYRIPGSPGHGCGLGLAIVSEIVQLHGARIDLEKSPQGGLRIRITFQALD